MASETARSFFDDPAMLAPPRAVRLHFDGGAYVLRSPEPLKPYARCIGEWLEHWARTTPETVLRSAMPRPRCPKSRLVSTRSAAGDAPRRKEKCVAQASSA